jgi:hypothetical protein
MPFAYHINLEVNVSDENGGNVYAMIFEDEQNIETMLIKIQNDGISDKFTTMTPDISMNNVDTTITASVHTAYSNITHIYTDTLGLDIVIGTSYYAYLYLIDGMNNGVVIGHESNGSIMMSTDSTRVVKFKTYQFNELTDLCTIRNVPLLLPDISYEGGSGGDYVGLHQNEQYWDTKLYANVNIDPGEFAISKIYTFAFEEEIDKDELLEHVTTTQDETCHEFIANYVFKTRADRMIEIVGFYDNLETMALKSLAFGRTYYLYTVIPVHGLQYSRIIYSGSIVSGTPPVINQDPAPFAIIRASVV